ncbi:MAG: type I-B CRISPR-associated protein Cas7/Csh2, partial [Firmicutes bacterium]|nr:type I-B CRISPR-associated protein Cas7/Csh2 [Bacillota bacterium]
SIEISGLSRHLEQVKDRLDYVLVWQDPALKTTAAGEAITLSDWLAGQVGKERVRTWEGE